MSVDIYVMPIWKFKAGDFSSPLEDLGARVVTVTPGGLAKRRSPSMWAKWKAKRQTSNLRHQISQELGRTVNWNESGNITYRSQAHGLYEGLRAFAKWQDYQDVFATFDPPPEQNYYKHPVMVAKEERTLSYPHLVNHSCYNGYYLPTDMERVVYVEPYTAWGQFEFKRSAGSSVRLMQELKQLSSILGVGENYSWNATDPLNPVKAALSQAATVARLSTTQQMPIVFWG